VFNTLSNTPCFTPTGSGPIQDELYWIYLPSLDVERTSSILSSPSSPASSPSISPLANSHLHPLKEEGDTWVEVDPVQETEKEHRRTHSTLRRKENRKRTTLKEREERTKEWMQQTQGVGKLQKSQPFLVDEEHEEAPKPDIKANAPAKILKPNRPRPPQPEEDVVPPPPKPSTKLKKGADKDCCVIG
jgi:hypothetical protein